MILILISILILLVILLIINITYEGYTNNDGYSSACRELTNRRNFLYSYLNQLRNPVQDLSANMITAFQAKGENMAFQKTFTTFCKQHRDNRACKILASVDKYQFEVLPDMDTFYINMLLKENDLEKLYNQLNYYCEMLGCDAEDPSGNALDFSDPSGTQFDIDSMIGLVDTETLAIELQKLSPYYLSPDVVRFLLIFLISKEEMAILNNTIPYYLDTSRNLMNKIKEKYKIKEEKN